MIDFPDMVPLVCPTCRTEAPLGSRFCGMCGQPLGSPVSGDRRESSPLRTQSGSSRSDAEREPYDPQRAHSDPPSTGHEVRASSPDRRVQTSPVGTVLPDDVLSVLHAATSDRHVDRSDDTPRRTAQASVPRSSSKTSGPSSGRPLSTPQPHVETAPLFVQLSPGSRERPPVSAIPRQVTDEPTLPISYRPTSSRAAFGALRSVLFGLLWLLLAGLVAMLVIWMLPERPLHPPQTQVQPSMVPQAIRPDPARTARPTMKTGAPSGAIASSAPIPKPASSASTIDRAATSPLGTPSAPSTVTTEAASLTVSQPASAPASQFASQPASQPVSQPASQPASQLNRPLSAAERAAWQQDLANIEFVAATYTAQVRACYERAVRGIGGDPPRGRVELVFTLSDAGMAQNVSVSDDTLALPVLSACLSQRVSEWRFPRPVGPLRTFRFPFAFSGSRP